MKLIVVHQDDGIIIGKEICRLTKEETKECKMYGQLIKILNLETMQEEEYLYDWEEVDIVELLKKNER